jgi:signal transduction histidine kinase
MRNDNVLSKLWANYFDPNLDLRVQAFHLLLFVGFATGILIAAVSAVQQTGILTILFNLLPSALAILMLNIAGNKLSLRVCCWVSVIFVFMIAFPIQFFTTGGYRGGTPSFFIFAVIFTAIIFEKWERAAALAALFTIYVGCCLIAYFYPETVTYFATEALFVSDVITGIVAVGLLLLLVIMLYIRICRVREIQIQELNRELAARNETLTKFDRLKSDFLAAVAHEISTPLTVIIGSSADTIELVKENPAGIPENFDEIMLNHEEIRKRVKLLDGLVTDLMDTVAIESGRLPLSRQPVKLSELLQSVCDAGFKRIEANHNRFTYEFAKKLPPIWADPGKIEQVMTNLLTNADRHTKDGIITVKLTQTDGKQMISVTDNGEGMTPELTEDVMKMYATTSMDKNWRHGFGLYICRQIIVSHGGEIWVESEVGRGTTVTFTLTEEKDD